MSMKKNGIKIYCDGGARGNPGPAAAAFVVVSPEGKILEKRGKFLGRKTNNFAEYEAVRLALQRLVGKGTKGDVSFFLDSQLVVKQMTGKFKIKQPDLKMLAMKIKELEKKLTGEISYYSIPRNGNKLADFLVNKTLDGAIAAN